MGHGSNLRRIRRGLTVDALGPRLDSSSLRVAACYCGWTPAALITLVYLLMSLLTRWVSSPREFVTASAPFFSNWFFISGDCAIFTSSPCSRLRIGAGVPLGAKNPTH